MTTDPIGFPIPDHGIELPNPKEELRIEWKSEPAFHPADEPFVVDKTLQINSPRVGTQFDHYRIAGNFADVRQRTSVTGLPPTAIQIFTGDRGVTFGTGRIALIESLDSTWGVEGL